MNQAIHLAMLLWLTMGSCAMPSKTRDDRERTVASPSMSAEILSLPAPTHSGQMTLNEALGRRRSVREFTQEPLNDQALAQLVWAAQGITGPDGVRAAPSAGALYPLELYVATARGFFHYQPHTHQLKRLSDRDLRAALQRAALGQASVLEAPAVFVIAAVYERTAQKYGQARAPRYVHIEAGHAAQNLLLEAVALGLGGVGIGAFDDAKLLEALPLPADHQPIYLIPIGHPL